MVCFSSLLSMLSALFANVYVHLDYIGFADGASRSTQNIASAAWVIFSPTDELVSSEGICLGPATNKIARSYSVVIKLLSEALALGIRRLVVRLDS